MNKKLHFKSLLLLAAMLFGVSSAWAEEVTDELSQAVTGISGTSYKDFSGIKVNSDAVYAGQCAGDKSSIQLRSNNSNSGVITTTTGGKLKKIVVEWVSDTQDGRTLNIYGSNTAYTAATDLYNTDKQGTLIGTIVKGTSTELVVTGDFTFVGLRSASGAMYLAKVSITWDADASTADLTETEVTINGIQEKLDAGKTLGLTATVKDDESQEISGATVTWTSSDETVATIADGVITALKGGQTTITATYAGEEGTYKGSNASFILTVAGAIEDGIFDFSLGQDYGSGLEKSAVKVQTSTWVAGNVTMVASGRNCWYTDNKTFRLYKNNAGEGEEDNAGTLTFSVSGDGVVITKIEFTGNDALSSMTAAEGSYSNKTWEGASETVTISANPDASTIQINTITVTYGNPPSVEAPESSVPTGTYAEAQSVELTCATAGAEIYYTIDDSEPTTESTLYTGAIEVSETTTIKAIAATSDGVSTVMVVTLTFLPPVEITLTKDMETYCSSTALDFSESGLKVYTAKVEDGAAVLTEVTSGKVPANRGVILTGKPGTYEAKTIEKADKLEGNELYGVSKDSKVSYFYNDTYNYILQDGKFKKATGDKLKGGKAYLKTTYDVENAGARELKIVFADEATAIKTVKTTNDQNVYDLQGRKVAAPQKGLYIINGKKMIVK